jgi:hypothetical protein
MSLARYLSKLGALLNSDGKVPAAGLASGAARANFGAGAVLQVAWDRDSNSVATQSSTFVDGGVNASITPTSASSKILVFVKEPVTGDVDNDAQNYVEGQYRLMRDSTEVLLSNASVQFSRGGQMRGADAGFYYLDSPNTTSTITYKTQYKVSATPNGRSLSINSSGVASMVLMEIAG